MSRLHHRIKIRKIAGILNISNWLNDFVKVKNTISARNIKNTKKPKQYHGKLPITLFFFFERVNLAIKSHIKRQRTTYCNCNNDNWC